MGATNQGPVPAALTLAEARTFIRLGTGEDDAVLATLIGAATAICEQFIGAALVERTVTQTLPISGTWQRLAMEPVRTITAVRGVPADGSAFALPVTSYAIDIDSNGTGWVRVSAPGAAGRAEVTYQAGMAAAAAGVPEVLRQGVLMLTAHLYRDRDREVPGAPPAAVAALWRPWRRMRVA